MSDPYKLIRSEWFLDAVSSGKIVPERDQHLDSEEDIERLIAGACPESVDCRPWDLVAACSASVAADRVRSIRQVAASKISVGPGYKPLKRQKPRFTEEQKLDMATFICNRICEGDDIKSICDSDSALPRAMTFMQWTRRPGSISEMFGAALQVAAARALVVAESAAIDMAASGLPAATAKTLVSSATNRATHMERSADKLLTMNANAADATKCGLIILPGRIDPTEAAAVFSRCSEEAITKMRHARANFEEAIAEMEAARAEVRDSTGGQEIVPNDLYGDMDEDTADPN